MYKEHYRANYHTHCHLCRHAEGTVEDYVVEAIKKGYQAIGISDHAPLGFLKDRSVRMNVEDYPTYKKELSQTIAKYYEFILIYRSLEIEYFDHIHCHYEKLLDELDYLILGQHYIKVGDKLVSIYKVKTLEEMLIYKDTVIKAMKTKYFKILAHPDIYLFNQGEVSEEMIKIADEIIQVAKEENVLLEVNANGFRKRGHTVGGKTYDKYPREEFWKRVKHFNAEVIISSDAHHPDHLSDEAMIKAKNFTQQIELEVVEELVLD